MLLCCRQTKGRPLIIWGGGAEQKSEMNFFCFLFVLVNAFLIFPWRRVLQFFSPGGSPSKCFSLEEILRNFFLDCLHPPPQIIIGRPPSVMEPFLGAETNH